MREPIPSEQRCCGKEICCLHMSILQGACEQQCEDRENQPSGCLWVQIFRTGRRCRKKRFVYQCPFCNGLVNSNVKTGQIDHRSVCNNQFYVKDGEVSKRTRHQAHSCPVCSTVVWSSLSCGRIAVKHDMPSGKPCHNKQWHVPEKKTTKTKQK